MLVSTYMRGQLATFDKYSKPDTDERDDVDSNDIENDGHETNPKGIRGPILPQSDKYHLGARQTGTLTLNSIEQLHANDTTFKDFRKRLVHFVNNYVAINRIPLSPSVSYIRLPADYEVTFGLLTLFAR